MTFEGRQQAPFLCTYWIHLFSGFEHFRYKTSFFSLALDQIEYKYLWKQNSTYQKILEYLHRNANSAGAHIIL